MRFKSTIQIVTLALAIIPLAGCHSSHAAKPNISEPSGAQAQGNWQPGDQSMSSAGQPQQQMQQPGQPAHLTSKNEIVIPLHQETVDVGKRTVGAGQVTIHKRVTTQTVQQPIELKSETVDISREPAGAASQAQSGQGSIAQPFEEGSVTIQLNKEEPVVQKNTVVSGEVVARKNGQSQQQMVQSQVRQEDVQTEKSPDAVVINENGQTQIKEAAGANTASSAQDPQQFLQKAYQASQTEIQLGQLAQQKAQSQDLKQFGQHLEQSHQAMNQQLMQLASQKGVQLQNKLDSRHQAIIDRFSNLSPADFDRQFSSEQVEMQQKAINYYQQASTQNTDPDVKSFAQNNLTALRENLQTAQAQSAATEAAGAQQDNKDTQQQNKDSQPQQQQQQDQQPKDNSQQQ